MGPFRPCKVGLPRLAEAVRGPGGRDNKNTSDGFIGFRVQGLGFRAQSLPGSPYTPGQHVDPCKPRPDTHTHRHRDTHTQTPTQTHTQTQTRTQTQTHTHTERHTKHKHKHEQKQTKTNLSSLSRLEPLQGVQGSVFSASA